MELKNIKPKDRTDAQQKEIKRIQQQLRRDNENEENRGHKNLENKERMALKRSMLSPEGKRKAKCTDKERKASSRAKQSPKEKNQANSKNKKNMAENRAAQSTEEKIRVQSQNTERKAASRAKQSPEEKDQVNCKNKKNMAENRAAQSTEEKRKNNEKDRMRKARQKTSICYKEGNKSIEILQGSYGIAELKDTPDCIGNMDWTCQDCGALKFEKETASTCCNNGKVVLDQFAQPPTDIDSLWRANTVQGRMILINNYIQQHSLNIQLQL